MTSLPLFIMLCSGEHEKIQMAAMMASVGAVSDRKVHVFVSMNAILAFEKSRTTPESRYQGGPISKVMQEKGVPDALELFSQGKMLGELTMNACSMVMDVNGWDMDHLVDDLFDGMEGLTSFLSDAEKGQLITL
ncbi:MAG: DsrE/DsrF/DrsH-like family protein [Magnetococcales bacterium]|nr:DsrE/DsrF/DrsH-like family protein [Magnetococcales bacterium]